MDIYIKNIVCNRCNMAVSKIFYEVGFTEVELQLGKVSLTNSFSEDKLTRIEGQLKIFIKGKKRFLLFKN